MLISWKYLLTPVVFVVICSTVNILILLSFLPLSTTDIFHYLPPDSSPSTPLPTDTTLCPPPPPELGWAKAVVGANGGREAGKYCCLCGAWFNNPLMAQQHYEGKKHRRNAARARLLEQLAGSLDATESTGQPNTSDKWRAGEVVWLCMRKGEREEITFRIFGSEGGLMKCS